MLKRGLLSLKVMCSQTTQHGMERSNGNAQPRPEAAVLTANHTSVENAVLGFSGHLSPLQRAGSALNCTGPTNPPAQEWLYIVP